jgi:hypothetical protein
LITKDTLRELVLEAESFVRQKITVDQTSKAEYFFNEILLTKSHRIQHHQQQQQQKQQQHKKLMEKNQKDTAKISRVHVSGVAHIISYNLS